MENIEYKFGCGGIDEVSKGKVERKHSLEELDYSPTSSIICVPKIIGVYQENKTPSNLDGLIKITEELGILMTCGEREEIHSDLICIAYDPTIIDNNTLKNSLKGDVTTRLKIIDYLNLPDFYEKKVPDEKIFTKVCLDFTDANLSVLERAKEILILTKQDYGLTRSELVNLLAINNLLKKLGKSSEIINDPFTIKATKATLDLLKNFRSKDF